VSKPNLHGNSWRRTWRRADPSRRAAAANSLADVFAPRRRRRLLPGIILALSLAAHAPLLLLSPGSAGGRAAAIATEDTYLRKVAQRQRARHVSKDLLGRITMPPAPPDPESVVTETLSAHIAGDIEKVIGKTLDVRVTDRLARGVTDRLADELAEAARNIAAGRLSEREIRQLQEHFRRKAHAEAEGALARYRRKTQVTRAKISVESWYAEAVSPALRGAMHHELFVRRHNRIWWHQFASRPIGAIQRWNYTAYRDYAGFGDKVRFVEYFLRGLYHADPDRFQGTPVRGWGIRFNNWPEPSALQAGAMAAVLRGQLAGGGWRGRGLAEAVSRYVELFHPHRAEEMRAEGAKAATLWKQAIAAAEAYRAAAEDGGTGEALAAARARTLKAVRALREQLGRTWVGRRIGEFVRVNQAVRSRVFRGRGRDAAYAHYVKTMVDGLWPAVRQMAATEFREGILIRKEGVDETTRDFADSVRRLLRADVQAVLPRGTFEEMIFACAEMPYVSEVTSERAPPTAEQVAADEKAEREVLAGWPEADRAYPAARAPHIAAELKQAMERTARAVLERVVDEGRLRRDLYLAAESVDYTDPAAERLEARKRALAGRGQDLARLTDEGLPDTSASMTALLLGAGKGRAAALRPVQADMRPGMFGGETVRATLVPAPPGYPPPARWGLHTQAEIDPPFETPRFEAIPFLTNFPRLDGDLGDWGRVRPLNLRVPWRERDTAEPILVYAAWNYQGFFFGYDVTLPESGFAHPWEFWMDRRTGVARTDPFRTTHGGRWTVNWMRSGDHLRLFFDTLDARRGLLGQPHTQEFFIFPRGTENCPDMAGVERIFARPRDADPPNNAYGHARSVWKVFPPQPSPEWGPDGRGPYRVTKVRRNGYTTEVFLPRTLFRTPVFAPGWIIGFDCLVGVGRQEEYHFHGQYWACRENRVRTSEHHTPASRWGDLMMLGTDPRLVVQDCREGWPATRAIVPGHSYLLTVMDPDRNVNLTARDTVVVSAEAVGSSGDGDIEVYVLQETGRNTSVFRGCIDTQPGPGWQVEGNLEVYSGQTVRLGYVDFGNARGQRNVVYRLRLPVAAPLARHVVRAGGPRPAGR